MANGTHVWVPIMIGEFELVEELECKDIPEDFVRAVANDVIDELREDRQLADKHLYPFVDAIFDRANAIVRRKYAESETGKE